jgi:hypothetical protein
MSARSYRGGIPAPPKDIALAMGEAGKADDQARLGILHEQYLRWLADQGYQQPPQGRPARADEVAR